VRAAVDEDSPECLALEGTLLRKEIYEVTGTSPLQVETYLWNAKPIVLQLDSRPTRNYIRGPGSSRRLLQRTIERDGEFYTTRYSDFDDFDNVGQVVEYTGPVKPYDSPGQIPSANHDPLVGPTMRTMEYVYEPNTTKWLLRL